MLIICAAASCATAEEERDDLPLRVLVMLRARARKMAGCGFSADFAYFRRTKMLAWLAMMAIC